MPYDDYYYFDSICIHLFASIVDEINYCSLFIFASAQLWIRTNNGNFLAC